MIKATIVADSLTPNGDRLSSLLITFPRIILAELNTHRMLSKNSASSRAIPFEKMVKSVQENPFIPIAWQKEHKGMQGTEYFSDGESDTFKMAWLISRDKAVEQAEFYSKCGVTKQLCNRLLEPFMYHTVLITGNVNNEAWLNFFDLRCPQYEIPHTTFTEYKRSWKDVIKYIKENFVQEYQDNIENASLSARLSQNKGLAEIHMMQLAECIYDAVQESTPKQLEVGDWHIPFRDKIKITENWDNALEVGLDKEKSIKDGVTELEIKISTSMCARTSYTIVGDEKEVSYQKHIELYEKLINQKPLHASPMEHCSRAMTNEEYNTYLKGKSIYEESTNSHIPIGNSLGWCRNYKGFIQLRQILENDTTTF